MRALVLEIAVPPQMQAYQVLEFRAGDWSGSEVLYPGDQRRVRLPITAEAGEVVEVSIHASTSWLPGGADTRALAGPYRQRAARALTVPNKQGW